MLETDGLPGEAVGAFPHAARLTTSIPEQRYLSVRATAVSDPGGLGH
ncbi:MAG: hypothetical protein M3237_11930 [Actinomycetota bacterium]|nr:hypothetical protein [Actinomycetota bacterium]